MATRTRLLLVEAWASEAETEAAAERDGEGLPRRGRRPAASLSVSASQPLHFWPKALAVRSASASAPDAAAVVEVAVAGGPGVVLFSLSRPLSPPAPSAAAAAEEAAARRAAPSPRPLPISFSRLRTMCSPWPACAVCYSLRGDLIAAAGPAGQLWIWGEGGGRGGRGEGSDDAARPVSLLLPPLSAPLLHAQVPHERVTALEFSPCDSQLAVACWGGAVLLYSRKGRKKNGEETGGGGGEGEEEEEPLLPPPLLPAGLTSGPAILALEPSAEDGGPAASDWELSGGIRPSSSAPASSAASSASGPRATLLAWRKSSPSSSPRLLAVARAGRSLAVVSVEEKGRSRECRVAWEAPAGVVVVESTGGEGREEAETREENGGDGRGPLPEGLPSLRLPARAAAGAGGKGALPLPPAPALPLPAGVRGLAVCDEGGSTILWCDGEGRLGRARW